MKGCSLLWGTEPWPLDSYMLYFTDLKKSNLTSFLIQEIWQIFTSCAFSSLLKKDYINLCPGEYNQNNAVQCNMLLIAYSTAVAKEQHKPEGFPLSQWDIYRRDFAKIEMMMAHYNDVIMTTTASQITSLTVVYSTVYSDADQRKHQSSASLAFVRGIHRAGEFPAQRASYAENVSIWWRHHEHSVVNISLREYSDLTTSCHESTVRCYAKLENIYYPIGS